MAKRGKERDEGARRWGAAYEDTLSAIARTPGLGFAHMAVFSYLTTYADRHTRIAYPTRETMVERLGKTGKYLTTILHDLQEKGFLRIERISENATLAAKNISGARRRNCYTLLDGDEYQNRRASNERE